MIKLELRMPHEVETRLTISRGTLKDFEVLKMNIDLKTGEAVIRTVSRGEPNCICKMSQTQSTFCWRCDSNSERMR